MAGRDPDEAHRSSTPLELFFDLVFVVAVARAAERLHHALLENHADTAILGYVLVFFALWWCWVNYTWFASAFDNDDLLFRLATFVVMTGALVMAAGIPGIFDERVFTVPVIGYVIMRVALVGLWLRVARDDPLRRPAARRFALGISVVQIGWIVSILVPSGWWPVAWAILAPADILVPIWAERAARTTWHPGHIAERYGLFMIIVLGEGVLAASMAVQLVVSDGLTGEVLTVIVGGLLILYSMWWLYYDRPDEHLLDRVGTAFVWSLLHMPIFAGAAAVGAGLVVAIEEAGGHAHLGWTAVGSFVAVPLAIFLGSIWLLYVRSELPAISRWSLPTTVGLLLLAPLTPSPILAIGLILVGMVAAKIAWKARQARPVEAPSPAEAAGSIPPG